MPNQWGTLSPREQQVLGCLLGGDSEKQIARRLGISSSTVHGYVRRIYRLFDVHSRGELLACLLRQLLKNRPRNPRPVALAGRRDWKNAKACEP
jgi:DNA-binding CsgD family transcriptional regulator